MSIAKTVENFLQEQAIRYTVIDHPHSISSKETAAAAHVAPDEIAKAVMLGDDQGCVMAVVPGDSYVELHTLSDKLHRPLALMNESRIEGMFADCEPGAIPPLGPAYHVETIVDERLVGRKQVCFTGGDHDRLVCVRGKDFVRLLAQARFIHTSH